MPARGVVALVFLLVVVGTGVSLFRQYDAANGTLAVFGTPLVLRENESGSRDEYAPEGVADEDEDGEKHRWRCMRYGEGQSMSPRERGVVAAVLLLIALLVAADVASDLRQGASAWHVLLEVLAGGLAVVGAMYLLHGTLQ